MPKAQKVPVICWACGHSGKTANRLTATCGICGAVNMVASPDGPERPDWHGAVIPIDQICEFMRAHNLQTGQVAVNPV